MKQTTEIRCALEIREDQSRLSPGRIVGTLLTYGERQAIGRKYSRPGL